MNKTITASELAGMIDHTILKAQATADDVEKLCAEALENNFASVCINPVHVDLVSRLLKDSNVKTCAVVGFPLGANSSSIKAAETAECVKNGAEEIDMVINIGALKSGNIEVVEKDIEAVVQSSDEACVKVIIECCYLTDEEKTAACLASRRAGADYVKTSTGFGSHGAKSEDVALMKKVVPELKVKAAGGIRDLETALQMIKAGADRIGASAGISILKELKGE